MNPLTAPAPKEVPLAAAPLECVLAQVRFPMIVSINEPSFIGPFQEAIRERYPILQQEHRQEVRLGSEEVAARNAATIWRFSDDEGWKVSLASDFLALETKQYKSRTDFIERLRHVFKALQETLKPSRMNRLGIRYIDRVHDGTAMQGMVIPEILGVLGTWIGERSSHVFTESQIEDGDYSLLVRWGLLPPEATLDTSLIKPLPQASWILDIDAFTATQRPFEADSVADEADVLAQKSYAFFRWAVTDKFLETYGGNP